MTTLHVRRMLLIAAALTIGVATVSPLVGPSVVVAQQASTRRFDVISIKCNTSTAMGGTTQNQPGRFVATNISLRMLIRNAYGLLESQIVGGPKLATAEYMTAERFDIEATFTGEATREERSAMMRNLLADRFKVVTHTEMRDMPVYVLSKSRPDGRLGPQFKVTDPADCEPPAAGTAPGTTPVGGAPGTPPRGAHRVATRWMSARSAWRPPALPAGMLLPGVTAPRVDPDKPDLFTALQEQLGLKLEPQRAPIEVLIIDSAETPSDN